MKVPFLDLKAQFNGLKDDIVAAMEDVSTSGQYILGPVVESFEKQVAEYLGAKHAIGVGNGTDALWLSLKAVGVGPGDRVLTTPFTFFATASAIVNTGAKPDFADIDPGTFNLDPERVKTALEASDGNRVRAIVPVHLYGQPAEMDALIDLADRFRIPVVEDAAQAIDAEYKATKAGLWGEAGCFSFYPTKNLGALGDGGLVVTQDESTATKVRLLRAHGAKKKYIHDFVGTNSRLDALQAAILSVKLKHLGRWLERRSSLAARYTERLADVGAVIATPVLAPQRTHTFHLYVVRVIRGERDQLQAFLLERGIETGVYYPLPLHLQPALQSLGYSLGDFPEAEKASKEVLSLPLYPEMTTAQQDSVIAAVKEFANGV